MKRWFSWVLAVATAGCASTKPSGSEVDRPIVRDSTGMPFIKLAQRKLALVAHWVGKNPAGATGEAVQWQVARRLKTSYREPLFEFLREGAFDGFDAPLYGLVYKFFQIE